jgi:nucleotide-binding universal stress UspA family protein
VDTHSPGPAGLDTEWPERMVVGVDSSPESVLALDRAFELARRAGSTVVCVHAEGLLEEGGYRQPPDMAEIVAAARERVGCPDSLIAEPVYEPGHAADVLVRVAQRVGADLLVVGNRGIGRTLGGIGSTSAEVIETAHLPVLVVRPPLTAGQ